MYVSTTSGEERTPRNCGVVGVISSGEHRTLLRTKSLLSVFARCATNLLLVLADGMCRSSQVDRWIMDVGLLCPSFSALRGGETGHQLGAHERLPLISFADARHLASLALLTAWWSSSCSCSVDPVAGEGDESLVLCWLDSTPDSSLPSCPVGLSLCCTYLAQRRIAMHRNPSWSAWRTCCFWLLWTGCGSKH